MGKVGKACILVALLINLLGVGYGYYSDILNLHGFVSTGNIDVVFDDCTVQDNNLQVSYTDARIDGNKKRLLVKIRDAYPGDNIDINYKAVNNGTIPVVSQVMLESEDPAIAIDIPNQNSYINGYGDSMNGNIRVTLGNVEEKKSYNFSIDLLFHQ